MVMRFIGVFRMRVLMRAVLFSGMVMIVNIRNAAVIMGMAVAVVVIMRMRMIVFMSMGFVVVGMLMGMGMMMLVTMLMLVIVVSLHRWSFPSLYKIVAGVETPTNCL